MNDANEMEILLIEDNPHDAELAMRALGKRNLRNRIVWAKDGAEALDLLFGPDPSVPSGVHLRPRVILLDLKLPKVDGLEVLRRLKGDESTKHLPVVIMTSSREERDIVHSYQLGVNSYIVKLVDFDGFSEAVAQLGLYWLLLNQTPPAV